MKHKMECEIAQRGSFRRFDNERTNALPRNYVLLIQVTMEYCSAEKSRPKILQRPPPWVILACATFPMETRTTQHHSPCSHLQQTVMTFISSRSYPPHTQRCYTYLYALHPSTTPGFGAEKISFVILQTSPATFASKLLSIIFNLLAWLLKVVLGLCSTQLILVLLTLFHIWIILNLVFRNALGSVTDKFRYYA